MTRKKRKKQPPRWPPLTCADCGGSMPLVANPWRRGQIYMCEHHYKRGGQCRATLGAHPNGEPLGVPATEEVRKARSLLHDEAFDPLWKPPHVIHGLYPNIKHRKEFDDLQRCQRSRVYGFVGHKLGLGEDEMHMAAITDLETLRNIWRICKATKPDEVSAWAKARKEEMAT